MNKKINRADYAWVITESQDGGDIFVGLGRENGRSFIPVTRTREEGQALLSKLPAGQSGQRQVEAIHKSRILDQAAQQGFAVYLVDEAGKVLEKLQEIK